MTLVRIENLIVFCTKESIKYNKSKYKNHCLVEFAELDVVRKKRYLLDMCDSLYYDFTSAQQLNASKLNYIKISAGWQISFLKTNTQIVQ